MTVQEIMERSGMKETTLAIAWMKDAFHLIQSNVKEHLKVQKSNIIDGIQKYPLPADIIAIKSISVKDTNDSKYKKIRRLAYDPVITEDTDPE
tara:strand:+ start:355 stop:633 length:279 start_codon:yes stop_codon:yes gene_type:complete